MTPEAKFWNAIKDKFAKTDHLVRVENSSSRGTPDITACIRKQDMWIELKVAESDYKVLVRKEQRVFGIKRSRAGGKVFVIARMPDEAIHCWKYPIEMRQYKDTDYQEITDSNYYIADLGTFHFMIDFMLR